jgi:hypothetical protein
MASLELFGTRLIVGPAEPPPPGNENRHLLPDWMTPAEAIQWVRRRKGRLSRELADDARLWACPEHRRTWEATLGIEAMVLRRGPGVREG